ncbi:MAG: hypothetical protein RMM17_14255 [Acidobacteriota bacterium]|nr:hypothetical protein [Acidobacteriota bacterium]
MIAKDRKKRRVVMQLMQKVVFLPALIALLQPISSFGQSCSVSLETLGSLSKSNNIVFSEDGSVGYVAAYKEVDGQPGHSVYSFDTSSGNIISRLDTLPSGIYPTRLELSRSGTLLVSARAVEDNGAAFVIVPTANGLFDESRRVTLSIAVPKLESEESIPDKVAITSDGLYGIYSNKVALIMFSLKTGQVLFYEELVGAGEYAVDHKIQSLSCDLVRNRVAVVLRRAEEYKLLIYTVQDATLAFERILTLPEPMSEGSTVAISATKVTLAFSGTGNVVSYEIATGQEISRTLIEELKAAPALIVKHSLSDDEVVYIQRPGHGKKGKGAALAVIDSVKTQVFQINESLIDAAILNRKAIVLMPTRLRVYDLDGGEHSEHRLSQQCLNFSLGRDGLAGIVTERSVELVDLD